MIAVIEFRNEELAPVEEATYNSAEFTLLYRQRPPIKEHRSTLADQIDATLRIDRGADYLVIADTLTIVFSRGTRELVAFDAYTNRGLWGRAVDMVVPDLSGTGGIYLLDSLPEGRLDLCVSPTYTYSDTQSLLKITLGCDADAKYYRVSNRLLVGLHREGLASLLVQGLVMK